MARFKAFVINHPIFFGLILVFLYSLLSTLSYPVHFLFPENEVGQLLGDTLSKAIIFVAFVLLLWRFGWIKASGLLHLGKGADWLIFLGLLIYKLLIELYAFTGDFLPVLPSSTYTMTQVVYFFPSVLVEESMYRALLLLAMILAWGDTKQGIVKAALYSSFFFGMLHLFNILVRPAGVVLFQAVIVSLPGLLYAAIVLKSRTLWPVILLHWLTNAFVNVKISQIDNYQETTGMWILWAVLLIPLIIYSAILLWQLPEPYEYDEIEDDRLLLGQRAKQLKTI